MPEILRCSCRGNNADCHMCFGSGTIEETKVSLSNSPVRKPAPVEPEKAPSKQHAPRPVEGRLETAVFRVCGPARRRDAEVILATLQVVEKRVEAQLVASAKAAELKLLLSQAAMAEREYAQKFFIALAYHIRNHGSSLRSGMTDLSSFLRIGGSKARVKEETVALLIAAQNARKPVKEAPEEQRMTASPSPAKPTSNSQSKRKAVVEHLIVMCDGAIDEARLADCARFIDRHKLKFLYLAGSKKAVRELGKRFTDIDTIAVSNEANLAAIRSRDTSAVFNVGPRVNQDQTGSEQANPSAAATA